MIGAIGETPEFRQRLWDNATDSQRDKFKIEMTQWRKNYPLTNALMFGNMNFKEEVVFVEDYIARNYG